MSIEGRGRQGVSQQEEDVKLLDSLRARLKELEDRGRRVWTESERHDLELESTALRGVIRGLEGKSKGKNPD